MKPVVRFLPSGGLIAVGMAEGEESRIRLFDSPIELANAPRKERGEFSLLQPVSISCGTDALTYFYETAPFLSSRDTPMFTLGEKPTPAFRAAFGPLTERGIHFLRGERGEFIIGLLTEPDGAFRVAGITAASRTLTVRLEDIWHLLPPGQRALSYDLSITRDPNRKDTPEALAAGVVQETFPGQPGNLRVVLDLSADGGFLLSSVASPTV